MTEGDIRLQRSSHAVTFQVLALFLATASCALGTEGYRSEEARERTLAEAYAALASWNQRAPSWFEPAKPHRVIANIYSIGPRGLGVYLIEGEDGHILIDGGMLGEEAHIVEAIEAVGLSISDVKVLLNSHAHFDHSGGLAELKRLSGAALWSSAPDREALETGRYAGSEEDAEMVAPPVAVDRSFTDGDRLKLGDIELTAHLTPGHSPGCTTFTMSVEHNGETLMVLFFGSATVAANRLDGPPQYPGIVTDYRRTFEKLSQLSPDVPLSNHPSFLGQDAKAAAAISGDRDAYIDRELFPALVKRLEVAFETQAMKVVSPPARPPGA